MRFRYALPLVLALTLSISACSRGFKLAAIPSEDIPVAVREDAERQPNTTSIVWRACYEQDGYLITVNTHVFTTPSRSHQVVAWLVHQESANGQWTQEVGSGRDWGPEAYSWGWGESTDHIGTTHINAKGWAFTQAAHRVVGTTTCGRFGEGHVVNGFWFLLIQDVAGGEVFETVVLEDDQGRVLHTYRQPQ